MHIVGIMFFLTVLALAIGAIVTVVFEYKDRIIGALLGSEMSSHNNVVLINVRPIKVTSPQTSASNEDFSLPLAA